MTELGLATLAGLKHRKRGLTPLQQTSIFFLFVFSSSSPSFSNAIFRRVVQQLTRFQLTQRVARSLCHRWTSCFQVSQWSQCSVVMQLRRRKNSLNGYVQHFLQKPKLKKINLKISLHLSQLSSKIKRLIFSYHVHTQRFNFLHLRLILTACGSSSRIVTRGHQPITGLHFVDWQLICIIGHAHLSGAKPS